MPRSMILARVIFAAQSLPVGVYILVWMSREAGRLRLKRQVWEVAFALICGANIFWLTGSREMEAAYGAVLFFMSLFLLPDLVRLVEIINEQVDEGSVLAGELRLMIVMVLNFFIATTFGVLVTSGRPWPLGFFCLALSVIDWLFLLVDYIRRMPKGQVNWENIWWGIMQALAAMSMTYMPFDPPPPPDPGADDDKDE